MKINFNNAVRGFTRLMHRKSSYWADKDTLNKVKGLAGDPIANDPIVTYEQAENTARGDIYYFYNGRGRPKVIDMQDRLVVISDQAGDITEYFSTDHNRHVNLSDKDYNEKMYMHYNILRNPPLYILQEINRFYGLGESEWLDKFVNEGEMAYA